jgi:hypothetical protein
MLRNNGFRQLNQFNASAKFKVGDVIQYGSDSGNQYLITNVNTTDYTFKVVKSKGENYAPVGTIGSYSISTVDAYYRLAQNNTLILALAGVGLLILFSTKK